MNAFRKTYNRFTLSFNEKAFEKSFSDHYFQSNLFFGRLCHLLAILFYLFDGLRDFYIFKDHLNQMLVVRCAFIVPMFTGGLFFSFLKPGIYQKIWQRLFAFYFFATGLGAIALTMIVSGDLGRQLYVGLIYVMVFGYTFIRLRFVYALPVGWLLTGLYFYSACCDTDPSGMAGLWIQIPFLLGVNLLGSVVAYTMEYYFRKNFYFQSILQAQQKELDQTNANLESLVEERTRLLFDANRELEDKIKALKESETRKTALENQLIQAGKMEAVGRLAGGIAHDFNNILFPILANAEILLADHEPDHPSYEIYEQIYKSALRASELVRQINYFSRQKNFQKQHIDMTSTIREALALILASVPSSVSINRQIRPIHGKVVADPVQIHQILMNLFSNAYHALEKRGGQIDFSVDEIIIDHPESRGLVLHPGTYVKIGVQDNGSGIPPEHLENIFDPFFTTKKVGEGTGIGLSIVHGIIRNLHGEITVRSSTRSGTRFDVYLPLIKEVVDAGAEAAPPEKMKINQGSERIMLVDDEPDIVHVEEKILLKLGYRVTAYTDSREALAAFQKDPGAFDLVITDMVMPNLKGDALCRELVKLRPDIPILMCTGFSFTLSRKEAETIGIRRIITKPVGVRDLSAAIRSILGPDPVNHIQTNEVF